MLIHTLRAIYRLFCCLILLGILFSCSKKTSYTRYKAPSQQFEISHSHVSDLRNSLVQEAQKQVGAKYRYGSMRPGAFDCSGLTCYIYNQHKIALERTSNAQSRQGKAVKLEEALPGDLLFFGKGKVDHVGILIRRSSDHLIMIHSSSSRGVIQTDINASSYWRSRFRFARRIL